jgi:UDP-N-acetyl-D-mannosaminuronate dehydrogenase
MNAKIKIYDPYFKSQHIFSHKTEDNFLDSITNTDAVIIITAHNEFHDIDPTLFVEKMISPVIVDTRGMIDVHAAKKAGIIFRGIGRGGI